MPTLRELRTARGWSMRKLSEISGVNISTISNCERKSCTISPRNYKKLVTAFDGEIPEDLKIRTKNGRQKFDVHPDTVFYRARVASGFSTTEVCRATGIPSNSLCRLETRGTTRVTPNAQLLADFYGIPVEELITPRRHFNAKLSPARKLRFERKLTSIEVANNIGIPFPTLLDFENGAKGSRKLVERLANFYGVEPVVLDSTYTVPGHNSQEDFAKLVAEYREAAGLTVKQLSNIVGVHETTLRRVELGVGKGSKETRLRIAKVLKIPQSQVLNFDLRHSPREAKRRKPIPPTPEQQIALNKLKFKSIQGKHFIFTPLHSFTSKNKIKVQILKLRERRGKYLFFVDSGGCTHSFTRQQLNDYKIRPATEQEIHDFEHPIWA